MKWLEIIDIVLVVICVIVYAIRGYHKAKGNLVGVVVELIAMVESTGLKGREKMAMVVEGLYEKVPAAFKPVLTEERLEEIAQKVFNWMREYAEAYIEATTASETEEERQENVKEGFIEVSKDAITDIISDLLSLSVEELTKKAENYGVELEGKSTQKEIIEAIITAAFNRA